MNIRQESETAFGRPASWWAALPAVVVGCGAFLLAVYGTWIMPGRLRPQYLSALEQSRTEYQKLSQNKSPSVSWKIGEVAGEMDVIYSRLVGLEGVDADRYWEWANFLRTHAATVDRKINNPAASVQPETRQRLTDQAQQFETKASEIVEQLAAGKSHLKSVAFLRMARSQYEQGLAEFGVRQPQDLITELRELLQGASPTTAAVDANGSGAGQLQATQVASAQLLLVQLMIEAAWQADDQSRLQADAELLHQAWEQYRLHRPTPLDGAADVRWQVAGQLLAAMTGEAWPANDADAVPVAAPQFGSPAVRQGEVERDAVDTEMGLEGQQRELAEMQLAALQADWTQLSYLLSRRTETSPSGVTNHLARTICRLACSPLAEIPKAWADQSELGILLVVQIAPHLPETSELLWECSRQPAGLGDASVAVSPLIAEAIVRGQSAALKHSISALSAVQAGETSVARTHLQLIHRAHAGLGLVARTVLWRAQTLGNADGSAALKKELTDLITLLTAATQLEPESGLNWFTLGTLQFRAQQYEAMEESLRQAQKLLGEVPAIDQMFEAAGG